MLRKWHYSSAHTMGGKNPYLKVPTLSGPEAPYRLRVRNAGAKLLLPTAESGTAPSAAEPEARADGADALIRIEPARVPYSSTGQPGSLLDVALAFDIDIDHACGGVSACSTCHIYVRKGLASCNEASDEELDMLDLAPATNLQSRLACQCVPNGSEEIEIEIPGWNRNAVRESHG